MEKLKTSLIITLLLATALMIAPIYTVKAETIIWDHPVYSSGVPETSPVLYEGYLYRIEASEIFWYDYANNLEADAMYYTTNPNEWVWTNHFPAPGGHSFLRINGADVNWGPFSNGDAGHTYSITYKGKGKPITFRIVDWVDGIYTNNNCHLRVRICIVQGGFTPGYWKNHRLVWPTGYDTNAPLSNYFGPNAPDVTLREALSLKGGRGLDGAKEILARAATAALLNTAYFDDYYPVSLSDLKAWVTAEFSSGTRDTILSLATQLDNYNNLL
jgi:hypothetical protein